MRVAAAVALLCWPAAGTLAQVGSGASGALALDNRIVFSGAAASGPVALDTRAAVIEGSGSAALSIDNRLLSGDAEPTPPFVLDTRSSNDSDLWMVH